MSFPCLDFVQSSHSRDSSLQEGHQHLLRETSAVVNLHFVVNLRRCDVVIDEFKIRFAGRGIKDSSGDVRK